MCTPLLAAASDAPATVHSGAAWCTRPWLRRPMKAAFSAFAMPGRQLPEPPPVLRCAACTVHRAGASLQRRAGPAAAVWTHMATNLTLNIAPTSTHATNLTRMHAQRHHSTAPNPQHKPTCAHSLQANSAALGALPQPFMLRDLSPPAWPSLAHYSQAVCRPHDLHPFQGALEPSCDPPLPS